MISDHIIERHFCQPQHGYFFFYQITILAVFVLSHICFEWLGEAIFWLGCTSYDRTYNVHTLYSVSVKVNKKKHQIERWQWCLYTLLHLHLLRFSWILCQRWQTMVFLKMSSSSVLHKIPDHVNKRICNIQTIPFYYQFHKCVISILFVKFYGDIWPTSVEWVDQYRSHQ